MDGHRTNWTLYNLLCNERVKEENPTLINIGSCGHHIIHVAFKNGVQATNWNISKLLKVCFALFHDSPARQADFVNVSGCDMFPFAFRFTHWAEDKKVTHRLLLIWDKIKAIIKFRQIFPKLNVCNVKTT